MNHQDDSSAFYFQVSFQIDLWPRMKKTKFEFIFHKPLLWDLAESIGEARKKKSQYKRKIKLKQPYFADHKYMCSIDWQLSKLGIFHFILRLFYEW